MTEPIIMRIKAALAQGPMTTLEVATEVGVQEVEQVHSLARILRDMRWKGLISSLPPEYGNKRADYRWANNP